MNGWRALEWRRVEWVEWRAVARSGVGWLALGLVNGRSHKLIHTWHQPSAVTYVVAWSTEGLPSPIDYLSPTHQAVPPPPLLFLSASIRTLAASQCNASRCCAKYSVSASGVEWRDRYSQTRIHQTQVHHHIRGLPISVLHIDKELLTCNGIYGWPTRDSGLHACHSPLPPSLPPSHSLLLWFVTFPRPRSFHFTPTPRPPPRPRFPPFTL